MNEPSYPYEFHPVQQRFEFFSKSEKRTIKKVVQITEMERKNVYNLALLDGLEDGTLCDITESRNKDLRTVLATVMQILTEFLKNNPDSFVMFRGSDPKRHRLYNMIISRELDEMSKNFEVFGVISGLPFSFTRNTSYAFYIVKKKL